MLDGGRKFAIVLIVLAISTLLLVFSKLDAGGWERVVLGVVGLFFAANVVAKWSPQSPPPPQENPTN